MATSTKRKKTFVGRRYQLKSVYNYVKKNKINILKYLNDF